MFAAAIRRGRVDRMRSLPHWRGHLDEIFVKINGETHHLWRAVDHEGEILESSVTKRRDRKQWQFQSQPHRHSCRVASSQFGLTPAGLGKQRLVRIRLTAPWSLL